MGMAAWPKSKAKVAPKVQLTVAEMIAIGEPFTIDEVTARSGCKRISVFRIVRQMERFGQIPLELVKKDVRRVPVDRRGVPMRVKAMMAYDSLIAIGKPASYLAISQIMGCTRMQAQDAISQARRKTGSQFDIAVEPREQNRRANGRAEAEEVAEGKTVAPMDDVEAQRIRDVALRSSKPPLARPMPHIGDYLAEWRKIRKRWKAFSALGLAAFAKQEQLP